MNKSLSLSATLIKIKHELGSMTVDEDLAAVGLQLMYLVDVVSELNRELNRMKDDLNGINDKPMTDDEIDNFAAGEVSE